MIKYELPNGWYIRKYDINNFCIAQEVTRIRKSDKQEYQGENIIAYYATLKEAYKGAVKFLQLRVDTIPELYQLLKDFNILLDKIEKM